MARHGAWLEDLLEESPPLIRMTMRPWRPLLRPTPPPPLATMEIELDDQVEALATLANITSMFDWNYAESRALTERALRKDPSHVRALAESAVTTASSMVDHPSDELLSMVRERIARARALDPLSAWAMAIEAMVLVLVGRDQEAIETATKAVATDPNNFTAHWARVFTLAQQDRMPCNGKAGHLGVAEAPLIGESKDVLIKLLRFF